MSLVTNEKIRKLQRALYVKAKQEPTRSAARMPRRKPVRELGAGKLHAQFDEREGETERWTSRRARQRKTLRASGAAGSARHLASSRLYRTRAKGSGGAS